MAISCVGTSTASGTGSVSPTILNDPGVAGAFLLVVCSCDGGDTWSAPDNTWTQIRTDFVSPNGNQVALFYKRSAVGSGTYTFNITGNPRAMGAVLAAYTGVTALASIVPVQEQVMNADSTAQTSPYVLTTAQLTTATNLVQLVVAFAISPNSGVGTDSFAVPQGYTRQVQFTDASGKNPLCICDAPFSPRGVTPPATAIDTRAGGPTAGYAAYTLALVAAGPVFSAQPQNVVVQAGASTTFSVSATGSGGLSYQWYLNGSAISGATSSTYTTPALGLWNSGDDYYCAVTDSDSTIATDPATVTVLGTQTTVAKRSPWARENLYVASGFDGASPTDVYAVRATNSLADVIAQGSQSQDNQRSLYFGSGTMQ